MLNFALHVADRSAAWTVCGKFLAHDIDDSRDPCQGIADFVRQPGRELAETCEVLRAGSQNHAVDLATRLADVVFALRKIHASGKVALPYARNRLH